MKQTSTARSNTKQRSRPWFRWLVERILVVWSIQGILGETHDFKKEQASSTIAAESIGSNKDDNCPCPEETTTQSADDQAPVCIVNMTTDTDTVSLRQTTTMKVTTTDYSVPNDCRIVMAPSSLQSPLAGWGIFTLVDQKRGNRILPGDVVIHVTDLHPKASGMRLLLQDYLWNSNETGGFYEGFQVMSVLPGVGMLANGFGSGKNTTSSLGSNVLPFVPSYDEGGLTRLQSPGAGANTHYHNYSFFAQRAMQPGDEIFVNYGNNWFQERQHKLVHAVHKEATEVMIASTKLLGEEQGHRSVEWLRQNGMCLDNLRPGISRLRHAGRGAFASRNLPNGTIVAPVPVVAIPNGRQALDMIRKRDSASNDGTIVKTKQLLLNYCFGHPNSSLLLYPYGPMVNLINHASSKGAIKANVRLQWSYTSSTGPALDEIQDMSLDDVQAHNGGFLLELVALSDIRQGDEILLDYGREWSQAWHQHVQHWKPPDGALRYVPSYVHDDVIKTLRTERELKEHPYPDNVFTSCFYRYTDNKQNTVDKHASLASSNKMTTTTVRWNMTRGIFELRNLRPCNVLKRDKDPKKGTMLYTVQIRNRNGLPAEERISDVHIVTHVPRKAIRFSDKIYSSDQHLEGAFRHEIGFADYPEQWLDLVETTN